MNELSVTIYKVSQALAEAEARRGTYAGDPIGWHKRVRAASERLAADLTESVGARITDRWDGARIRIAGIVSSSTSGLFGAVHNWLAAAEKRASNL